MTGCMANSFTLYILEKMKDKKLDEDIVMLLIKENEKLEVLIKKANEKINKLQQEVAFLNAAFDSSEVRQWYNWNTKDVEDIIAHYNYPCYS